MSEEKVNPQEHGEDVEAHHFMDASDPSLRMGNERVSGPETALDPEFRIARSDDDDVEAHHWKPGPEHAFGPDHAAGPDRPYC